MIAVVIGGRRSIRALADYVLHDQATAADPRPATSERVEWTACLGVPMTDPQLMVRCMQGLAADAAILKSLAGVPASGRKLSNPYEHVVLSWPEGAKPPSRAHALDTVQGALDALGLDDRHRGIVVAHADTGSPHVHVLVSRVCPEMGRAVKVTKPAVRRLQRWAVDYERRTGGVVIENLVRRQQARAAFTAEVAALKTAGVPEKDAVDVARENNPLPPQRPRSERRRAGREKHTATERAEWRELNERQREQPDLHPGRAKAERVQLAQRQTRRRKRQKVFAPLKKLKLWQPAPDTTPSRREPAPKAATARIPGPDLQRLEAQIGAKRDQTRDQLRDAEAAVRKAERGAPRQQRTSAPASTTCERQARETFEVAVRDDRAARRTLRAAARDHAAARDVLAVATRAASRWTPSRQRGSEQYLAYRDADEHRDQARDAELVADGQARWRARNRQEARDRWHAAAADKRRVRQDRRQQARENRPARRRLQRLRQRVADLRRRLTTLDTALKAVERVLHRLGLSRRSAPPAPPPDISPSVSSNMRDLDRHIERKSAAPAPEPVRVAEPERTPSSTIPPAARVRREPPARERPPAAAPAGSRKADPRVQLVEDLIGAVCAGGSRLWRMRSEFERMDAMAGVKRLVPKAVDPELLEAVVGPRLASTWVEPLRAQYSRFKQAYPKDWVDVEKVWLEQRARWRPLLQERARVVNPPTPPAPAAGAADRAQRKQQSGPHHGR